MNNLLGRFCDEPFIFLYVGGMGKISLCCPNWLVNEFSIGNVFRSNDIQLIWNSEKAKLFRKSVCDGSFRYCNPICPRMASGSLPRIDNCDKGWQEIIFNPMKDLKYLPKKIQLSYDFECNLRCISCRHTSKHMSEFQLKRYDMVKDTILKPLLKDTEILKISGSRELFVSKHSLKYFDELNPEEYPKLRYHIMTNCTLFTEKNWNRYPFMQKMIEKLIISIDAAKKETYEAIRRGAKWEVLLNNLYFAGQLRKSQKIKALNICFVVQKLNYQEMVEFIQLGYEIGVDEVTFSRIANWGTYTDEEFIDIDVCDPRNKNHKIFLEVLKHPFFGVSRVKLGNINEFRNLSS